MIAQPAVNVPAGFTLDGTVPSPVARAITSARATSDGDSAQWCMMWCMRRTNIYLAEGQAAALDRAAAAEGVSRAELIRTLIDRALGSHPGADLAGDLAAIDSSFGVLADQETFSRGRDQRMDYLDRLADE